MSAPPLPARRSNIARFGAFEAHLDTRELLKQNRQMRLQDQPFAVLAVLLERAGTVVTREELRSRLWPADTFVDFDHSLNTAVNKLREVLGDSANSPRFIETLARRGYRFVADVQWDLESEPDEAGTTNALANSAPAIPAPHRTIPRSLFALIQLMYLIFYVEALVHWQGIDRISWLDPNIPVILIVTLTTAAVGIPVRFYLLSAIAFDHPQLGDKFHKIFLGLFILDQLWAISPFLILQQVGFGAALGATAALVYVPFAQRTLVRMAYPGDWK